MEGSIIPVGKVYYEIEEARLQKEKLYTMQMATIICLSGDSPPHVVQ